MILYEVIDLVGTLASAIISLAALTGTFHLLLANNIANSSPLNLFTGCVVLTTPTNEGEKPNSTSLPALSAPSSGVMPSFSSTLHAASDFAFAYFSTSSHRYASPNILP